MDIHLVTINIIDPNNIANHASALNDGVVPSISYQLLALAMVLASFLPALLYSYAKGFLDESDGLKKTPGYEKYKNNAIGFVYSIDLILSQSIILVFFSALYGLTVFIGTTINNSNSALCDIFTAILILAISVVYFTKRKKHMRLADEQFMGQEEFKEKYPDKYNVKYKDAEEEGKTDLIKVNIDATGQPMNPIIWEKGVKYLKAWGTISFLIILVIILCASTSLLYSVIVLVNFRTF